MNSLFPIFRRDYGLTAPPGAFSSRARPQPRKHSEATQTKKAARKLKTISPHRNAADHRVHAAAGEIAGGGSPA